MTYYRVKPEFDNVKADRNWNIFVGNELLTEKEAAEACRKFTLRNRAKSYPVNYVNRDTQDNFWKMFDKVEISCRKTYWFFGARFAMKEGAKA